MTQLTLVRHGETPWNASRRWQGFAPVPLNELGREQARATAAHLRNAGIERIVSSDLSRAYETAHIIATALGLPVQIDPHWREIDIGDWQGMSTDEIRAWDGERFASFAAAEYGAWHFPGGESRQEHLERSVMAIEALAHQYPNQHVLVATHGGTIRLLYHAFLMQQEERTVHNCSITRLAYNGVGWDLLCFAEDAAGIQWEKR